MMKSTRKLALSSETLRTLGDMDLTGIVGGADSGRFQCPVAADSGRTQCTAQAIIDSGRVQCPFAMATGAGR